MNIIKESSFKTLQKLDVLLPKLSNADLCNTAVPPYYSSIGSHVRHVLDFYQCIFNIDDSNTIDLTARCRNKAVETQCQSAMSYLNTTLEKLKHLDLENENKVTVIDDLGLGKTEITYTFGALLSQANSHTIHHYAIINYILDQLKIKIDDTDFGYNPTTPKVKQEKG